MEPLAKAKSKKAADIQVLRCLKPGCGGLLAYEVDSKNVLYVDLAWTACRGGGFDYFPCPKCDAKNVVEAFQTADGKAKHRVVRWEP
jgi:hypothetical protein